MGRLRVPMLAAWLAATAFGGAAAERGAGRRDQVHRVVEAIARLKLPDGAEGVRAHKTIEKSPPHANPYLARAARSDDALFRARVAHALGRAGKGSRDALFALAELLKDPDAFVRREAILALSTAGDASHVAAIEPLLADPVAAVRRDAVGAVAALAGRGALDRLRALLRHEDAAVRRAALAELVARKAPDLGTLAPPLLKDPDAGVRLDATGALASSGGASATLLMGLLSDKDALVRAAAVSALRGAGAKEAVARLIELLDDPSQGVRAAAISALGQLDQERVAVGPLIDQLTGASKRCRERAILALGFLGRRRGKRDVRYKRAWRAVPVLIQMIGDEDPDIRQKAHLALRFMLGENVVFNPRGSVDGRQKAMAEWQAVWQKKRGRR